MNRAMEVGTIVDTLGGIKALIKANEDVAEGLKADLIELAAAGPERSYEGRFYRATVSFTTRAVTDWKEVQERLLKAGVKAEVLGKAIADATKIAEGLPVVRVSAL